jgi:DUF3096 family protein
VVKEGFLHKWNVLIHITFNLEPVASLIAGVLILIMPRLLGYIVTIYIIVMGTLG